eukprot:4503024-Pyramimonas_sp.AAC.2
MEGELMRKPGAAARHRAPVGSPVANNTVANSIANAPTDAAFCVTAFASQLPSARAPERTLTAGRLHNMITKR